MENNCFMAFTCHIHSLQVVMCKKTRSLCEYLHVHLLSVLLHPKLKYQLIINDVNPPRTAQNIHAWCHTLLLLILGPSATKRPERLGFQRTAAVSCSVSDCCAIKGFNTPFNTLKVGGAAVSRDSSIWRVTCVCLLFSSKLLLGTLIDVFLIVEELRDWRAVCPHLQSALSRSGRAIVSRDDKTGDSADWYTRQPEKDEKDLPFPVKRGRREGEVTHIQMPTGAVHYPTLWPRVQAMPYEKWLPLRAWPQLIWTVDPHIL